MRRTRPLYSEIVRRTSNSEDSITSFLPRRTLSTEETELEETTEIDDMERDLQQIRGSMVEQRIVRSMVGSVPGDLVEGQGVIAGRGILPLPEPSFEDRVESNWDLFERNGGDSSSESEESVDFEEGGRYVTERVREAYRLYRRRLQDGEEEEGEREQLPDLVDDFRQEFDEWRHGTS
jgi:hypothetical protein